MTEDGKKISSELQDRLDDLFSDPAEDADTPAADVEGEMVAIDALRSPDPPPPVRVHRTPVATAESPLLDLNATILSLDWEITDVTLDRLITEIGRLKTTHENDKLAFMFLQLLGSIGNYISVKKVKAHPDSIKMLHSVYAGLEQVLLNAGISDLEKKKILSNEVRQFKSLKQRIRHTKSVAEPVVGIPDATSPAMPTAISLKQPPPGSAPPPAPTGELLGMETLLTEIRKVIRDEFEAFKTELRAMLGEE